MFDYCDAVNHGALAVDTLANLLPARDRCVPVPAGLADLLPEGGLRRGHVVACTGPAATSLALALVAPAASAGAWVAAVGLPELGIEAAAELGVPLQRLVLVAAGRSPAQWAERVAAAADGFELVLTTPPPGAERVGRQVRQRVQARGTVLVTVGVASTFGGDIEFGTADGTWEGLGAGYGCLLGRRLTVTASGRRVPRPRATELWLPGVGHLPGPCEHAGTGGHLPRTVRAGHG
jgi:hypothetical protein